MPDLSKLGVSMAEATQGVPAFQAAVQLGVLPGTFFCVRCDRNRWFIESGSARGKCAFCGHGEREIAAPGGLNPTSEQLAAARRRTDA